MISYIANPDSCGLFMNILTTLVFILLQYLYDGETCTDFVPQKDENREGITPAPAMIIIP